MIVPVQTLHLCLLCEQKDPTTQSSHKTHEAKQNVIMQTLPGNQEFLHDTGRFLENCIHDTQKILRTIQFTTRVTEHRELADL